jgi:hypothetical protein
MPPPHFNSVAKRMRQGFIRLIGGGDSTQPMPAMMPIGGLWRWVKRTLKKRPQILAFQRRFWPGMTAA